jgi:guanylate kinase
VPKGDIFVVSAPSGAGKTTLIRRLMAEIHGIHFSVSHTTRKPRASEAEGVDYHFTDDEKFDAMVASGDLFEWAEVHGHRYGTSAAEVDVPIAHGEDVLLDIDTQGAASIKKLRPDALLIFIVPPSAQALRERLAKRAADNEEDLKRRLEAAGHEVAALKTYDYCIVNDSLERALKDLQAIIKTCRLRHDRMPDSVREIARAFGKAKTASVR